MNTSRDRKQEQKKKPRKLKNQKQGEDDGTENTTASSAPSKPNRKGTGSSVESAIPSTGLAKMKSGLKKTKTGLSTKSAKSSGESVDDEAEKEEAQNTVGKIVAKRMRDDEGKLSITKILSTILRNMTVTPAMRNKSRFKAGPNQPSGHAPSGKGKQPESSSESESSDDGEEDVEVTIFDEEEEARRPEPKYWVNFHVPLDTSNKRAAFSWKYSEYYPLSRFNEGKTHYQFEKYLTTVLNDVRKPVSKDNPKNTLQVGLHFHEAIKSYDDQVAEDVKKCLNTLVRMLKFARLRVVCRFIVTDDALLADHGFQAEAVNMTAVIIQTLIDQIAVAGEGWLSTGYIDVRETRHHENPFTATKDFADGSKLREGIVQYPTMYRTTDAEQWLAFHERARLEQQPRHIATGTEADDEIRPAPLPKYYDQ